MNLLDILFLIALFITIPSIILIVLHLIDKNKINKMSREAERLIESTINEERIKIKEEELEEIRNSLIESISNIYSVCKRHDLEFKILYSQYELKNPIGYFICDKQNNLILEIYPNDLKENKNE